MDNVIKKLTSKKFQKSGKNNKGRLCLFHRGGGHKKRLRLVDSKRGYIGVPGKVLKKIYDPNRTGVVGLIYYTTGYLSYVLLSNGVNVGDYIMSKETGLELLNVERNGSFVLLKDVLPGELISNIELKKGKGGQMVRSGGSKGFLLKGHVSDRDVLVQLSSGEIRLISKDCRCSIGAVMEREKSNKNTWKAGYSRWLGRRPVVRGVAMNPVDHPHGGGEGKTSGGRCSVTPWGKLTKGKPTRSLKKKSSLIIKKRR